MTYETVGVSTSTSLGTIVTGGTAHNKTTPWVEIDASTAFAVEAVIVHINGNEGSNRKNLVDIGTGASSSEVVLIPDLLMGCGDTFGDGRSYLIPISIAQGTRLSARVQGNIGSLDVLVSITLISDAELDITPFTNIDAMGEDTSASGGTIIDPGGSADTKGVYVEIDASTAQNYKGLIIAIGQNGNNGSATMSFLMDIAIGVVDSEVNFIENLGFGTSSGADYGTFRVIGPIACDIPASSRVTVRDQCSSTNATDRLQDVVLYGLN